MELNLKIAFIITVLNFVITTAFIIYTYTEYEGIKVYNGEQIKTNDNEFIVKIDQFFKDDVSIPTVRRISKIIENELLLGAESDIYEYIKDLVSVRDENDIEERWHTTSFMKKWIGDKKDEDEDDWIEKQYTLLGDSEIVTGPSEISDPSKQNCTCIPSFVATKTCGLWKWIHAWGTDWHWLDDESKGEDNSIYQTYGCFNIAAGQYNKDMDEGEMMGVCVQQNGNYKKTRDESDRVFNDNFGLGKIYKTKAYYEKCNSGGAGIPGLYFAKRGDECQQSQPSRTYPRKNAFTNLFGKWTKGEGSEKDGYDGHYGACEPKGTVCDKDPRNKPFSCSQRAVNKFKEQINSGIGFGHPASSFIGRQPEGYPAPVNFDVPGPQRLEFGYCRYSDETLRDGLLGIPSSDNHNNLFKMLSFDKYDYDDIFGIDMDPEKEMQRKNRTFSQVFVTDL